jgi:hypothetical protein
MRFCLVGAVTGENLHGLPCWRSQEAVKVNVLRWMGYFLRNSKVTRLDSPMA